ncbi:hypothetical protein D3C79_583730 [compost metagenome]
MAGPQQVYPLLVELDQGQAHQRRLQQIKAFGVIRCAQLRQCLRLDLAIPPIEHGHWHLHLAINQLQRLGQLAVTPETGAQDVMAGNHCVPRRAEARDVQPLDRYRHLIDVQTGFTGFQGMEQHALLHRRQWVDVFNSFGCNRQCVQLGLLQACQREVGGGKAAVAWIAAMGDQGFEFALVVIGQGLNRGVLEHLLAEQPAHAQFAIENLPIEGQPVAQLCVRALLLATAFSGRREQRAFIGIEAAVELTQVVEGDAWLGQSGQAIAQVAQHGIADTLGRDCPQLLLDPAQAHAWVFMSSQ